MPQTPTEPSPELLARLARILETYQLQELVEVCEAAQAAGKGWYTVQITFKSGTVDEIDARFTRKPRPDQSVLLRRA